MSYTDFESAYRRQELLRILSESNDYKVSEVLLKTVLRDRSYMVSSDKLRTDCAWLAEQGLVTIRELGGVQIITLTERGLDVLSGAAIVPGIPRPEPGV